MDICIFGDSITRGYFDKEMGGWVNRLRIFLDNTDYFKSAIYNLGISGNTTGDVLKRLDIETSAREPEMIIFAIGVNDSIYIPKEKCNFVDFSKFEENIKRLVEKSKQLTKSIIFVGLIPVDESKVAPMPWALEYHYLSKDIEKYNKALRKICKKENIKFIDLYNKLINTDYKKFLSDGVHPNSEGHEWIADEIVKELNFEY